MQALQTEVNSNQMREAFLASLSHDVRGAITVLSGALCVLKATELSEHQRELTARMERASNLLFSLSNDVLDLSQMRRKDFRLCPTLFPLDELLEDMELMFRGRVLEQGLTWVCNREYPPGLLIAADKTRLTQILGNLLTNACKFTDSGSIILTVALENENAGGLRFTVEDSGVGIPREDLSLLFKEYYQCENPLAHKQCGSGLGLAISWQLVETMGGEFSVDSDPGKGSCFSFTLPVVPHSEEYSCPA